MQPNLKKRLITCAIVVAVLLLIPTIGMMVSSEWNWGPGDFIFAAVFLYGAAVVYELVARKISRAAYRGIFGIGLLAMVIFIWVMLATG